MAHVWYSKATDVTGKKVAEALEATHSNSKPARKSKIICWGAKTSDNVSFPRNTKVFNHPNKIRDNRHKYKALGIMSNSGVKVAPFSERVMAYPCIARTNYHQGGAGFWLCLNKGQSDQAISEGAQYFQEYIDIKTEYRLHVVDNHVVYAVKKVPRNNLKDAFVNHWAEQVNNYAAKRDINVNVDTLNLVLSRLGRKMATSVDMVTRSNTRGWKFSRVLPENIQQNLKDEAINAVSSLGLNFGAVDCCINQNNESYVIEVNTGPGLEGSSFDAVVEAIKTMINPPVAQAVPKAAPKAAKAAKIKVAKAGAKGIPSKAKAMRDKLALYTTMLDAAKDDAEIDALENIWRRM